MFFWLSVFLHTASRVLARVLFLAAGLVDESRVSGLLTYVVLPLARMHHHLALLLPLSMSYVVRGF